MDQPAEQSLPFRVRVLEGDMSARPLQGGQPLGTVELRGRALPLESITFEGTQRASVTWYPGNPVGTIQEHGPTEMPTVVKGVWKDRYLGDGFAKAMHLVFEEMRRRGPLLEVSWGEGVLASGDSIAVGDPFTRRGILKRSKFTYEIGPQRVVWELEFLWNGLADLVAPPVLATPLLSTQQGLLDAAEKLSTLQAFAESLNQFTQVVLVGAPARFLANVDDALSDLNNAAAALGNAGQALQGAATVPAQAAAALAGSLMGGVAAARNVIEVYEVFPEVTTAVYDTALDSLEVRGNVLTVLGVARVALEACARAAEAVQQLAVPDVIAEVRLPAGTDLRVVSMKYYDGDPDGWSEIASYNGWDTSYVPDAPTGPSDTAYPPVKIPRRGLAAGLAAGC